ncbi:hypothetical protein GGP41_001183 [Bipolaris sorokiniana]|uniref:Zn(2)-C6 fungal-type domain-containing protein n=1 Tax=Cochliobolus sativus TaxID=45130 RepID=A0A8H5ZBS6_COCSA|nr:hypothetical protein GGP41_001183 [Bipolaris sorokiniana]
MCPFTSLPSGEGPARFSPTAVKDWQPRRKSVSNACERCRRRKIRCDGETPCATCKRFAVQCIRTQKPKEVVASEHREALEGRIHQLEAQLARHVNAPMHGMESIDQNLMASTPTSFDWSVGGGSSTGSHLNLDTSIPATFTADDLDLGAFSARSGSMPSIAIDECTTRASSPDSMPSGPPPPPSASSLSNYTTPSSYSSGKLPTTTSPLPSGEMHIAPSWEFMAHPHLPPSQLHPPTNAPMSRPAHSRKTSTSSLSAGSTDQTMSPIPEIEDDLLPLAPAPRLPRQGIFAARRAESPGPSSSRSSYTDRSRALATTPLPSRFEAETLTNEFIRHLESLDYKAYSLSPLLFARFCEAVYPNAQPSSAVELSVSMAMARFHVFLAMAIAMKVRIRDAPEHTNALLETCYELAMQQTGSSTFWQEAGAMEAAQLLALFAALRKSGGGEEGGLRHSFSW